MLFPKAPKWLGKIENIVKGTLQPAGTNIGSQRGKRLHVTLSSYLRPDWGLCLTGVGYLVEIVELCW